VRATGTAAFALALAVATTAGAGAGTSATAAMGVPAGSAASAGSPPGLQISVEPLIVQFAIGPGGQASTRVVVKNVGILKAAVAVAPIDWHPTVDGTVVTERPGAQGGSSLGPYLRLSGSEFALAPGETREMVLSLVLPPGFSGKPRDYWAGYFVRAVPAGSPSATTFGVGANILTYETVGAPNRHVALTLLRVVDAGGGAVRVAARLVNDGGTYARPQIRMQLAQSGRVVQSLEDTSPAILAGQPRSYARTLSGLPRGTYALQLTVDYGGATLVQGTTDFTVR
jgi:hypothetical protein